MENKDKPAFFVTGGFYESYDGNGLTKREYIAAMVDVPWNAVIDGLERNHGITNPTLQQVVEYRASIKVLEADALLAELEKKRS